MTDGEVMEWTNFMRASDPGAAAGTDRARLAWKMTEITHDACLRTWQGEYRTDEQGDRTWPTSSACSKATCGSYGASWIARSDGALYRTPSSSGAWNSREFHRFPRARRRRSGPTSRRSSQCSRETGNRLGPRRQAQSLILDALDASDAAAYSRPLAHLPREGRTHLVTRPAGVRDGSRHHAASLGCATAALLGWDWAAFGGWAAW